MNRYDLHIGKEIWSQCGGYSVEVISNIYEKDGEDFFKAKDEKGNVEEVNVEFLYDYSEF